MRIYQMEDIDILVQAVLKTDKDQMYNLNYSSRNGNPRHLKCRPYPRIMGRGKKLHLIIYNLQK